MVTLQSGACFTSTSITIECTRHISHDQIHGVLLHGCLFRSREMCICVCACTIKETRLRFQGRRLSATRGAGNPSVCLQRHLQYELTALARTLSHTPASIFYKHRTKRGHKHLGNGAQFGAAPFCCSALSQWGRKKKKRLILDWTRPVCTAAEQTSAEQTEEMFFFLQCAVWV